MLRIMKGKKILLIDDEKDILELLEYALRQDGYEVFKAETGKSGIAQAGANIPDFILLDIMLPGMDGIELCRILRADSRFKNTSILFLTARSEEYSEIAGFEAGADDYIVKPIKIRSLLKRLETISKKAGGGSPTSLVVGDLEIDISSFLVKIGTNEIKMPRREFELLSLLAKFPGKVVLRPAIRKEIWGIDSESVDRSIDVHVRRLRNKIGEQRIETIKGVGYKLNTAIR